MEQRPQRALSVGRLSSKLAPQRQKAIHSPLFGPVTRRLLRSVHRRARRSGDKTSVTGRGQDIGYKWSG